MQSNHGISITPHILLTEADLWLLPLFSSKQHVSQEHFVSDPTALNIMSKGKW